MSGASGGAARGAGRGAVTTARAAAVRDGRLLVGGVPLVQGDATTCGATSVLAASLLTGSARIPAGHAPVDLDAAQRRLQAWMNRAARGPLGPLPWSRRIGSTPWAVAAELDRVAPARTPRAVHWLWPERWGAPTAVRPDDVARLRSLLAEGVPTALLVGGPLRLGRARGDGRRRPVGPALPRHYVLALPAGLVDLPDPGELRVRLYDPSSGAVGALDLADAGALAAGPAVLGGWTEVLALLLPAPSASAPAPQESGHER